MMLFHMVAAWCSVVNTPDLLPQCVHIILHISFFFGIPNVMVGVCPQEHLLIFIANILYVLIWYLFLQWICTWWVFLLRKNKVYLKNFRYTLCNLLPSTAGGTFVSNIDVFRNLFCPVFGGFFNVTVSMTGLSS